MFSIFKFKKISTVKRNEQHWFDLSDDRFFNGINREALIEFKKRIEHYATSTDIQSYIAQFHNLPEFKHKTEKTSLESLTPQAQSFLLEIEKLEMQSPFAALKLLVLLCCDEKVSFYKNHFILIEMIKRIQHGMTNDQIPCQDRLDFGFVCYQNWPLTGYYHAHQQQRNIQFSNKIFEEPLSISLIDYAQKSPDEALALFDKQFQPERSGFFLLAENDSYYFLKFIELLKDKRPKLYQDALLGYLSYTNLGEPIAPTKGDINEVLAQLYEILIDDQSPYHVDREKICKGLILYATPDQPWYSQLSQTLWDIEQQKIASDTLSIDNLFIAAMNAAEGAIFLDEICNCYKKWAKSYLNFSQDEFRPYLEHAKKILGKINLSLNKEYLGYHNSPPPTSQKNNAN